MRRPERSWLFIAPALALVQVAVGLLAPPDGPGAGWPAVGRLCLAVACSLTLVLGPGLALRGAMVGRGRPFPLAAVALPGPAIMALTGGLAWWGAGLVSSRVTATVVLTPVIICLAVAARRRPMLDPASAPWGRRAVLVAVVVLSIAVAKGTWSPGPVGELYGGTISRTLEVGGRSDSRISFHVVQLVAHGTSPYSAQGRSYFAPYSFSHRGPLAGMAASTVVLLSGARVPVDMPDQPWSPFDAEGFAAYRLAMSTMAVTSLMALFGLVSRLLGFRAGLQATLLAALTPFVVHEAYFTWPKLQAAGMVLVAAYLLLERRPGWAGLVTGTAYLVHPMVLLSLPTLALVWLLVLRGGATAGRRRSAVGGMAWMAAGVLGCLAVWRIVNGENFQQLSFLRDNILRADAGPVTGAGQWLGARTSSVLNTLLPLHLVVRDAGHPGVNSIYGRSPGVVVYFLQYWTGLPFGIGIVALPVLAARLWQAARLVPALFLAAVVFPFLVFATFWGGDATGLLREGMHVWVLTLIVVVAWAWARAGPLSPALARLEPACLALRAPETLLMLAVPAAVTGGAMYQRRFLVTDLVALSVMAAGLAWLGRESFRRLRPAPDQKTGGEVVSGSRTAPRGRWKGFAG